MRCATHARQLLMVERMYIRRELYLSIMLDRETSGPVMVASTAGGMSIEDVAEESPEKILKVTRVGIICLLRPLIAPTTALPD